MQRRAFLVTMAIPVAAAIGAAALWPASDSCCKVRKAGSEAKASCPCCEDCPECCGDNCEKCCGGGTAQEPAKP